MATQSTHSVPKLPLELAAAKLYRMGIKSWSDFKALSAGKFEGVERPADIPSHPTEYYEGLSSFDDFIDQGRNYLESGDTELSNTEVMTLDELKQVVHILDINSHRQWMQAVRKGDIPGYYPTRPDKYYPEWSGWKDFLSPRKRFLDFDDARKKARLLAVSFNLRTGKDWRNLSRARKRPKGLPSNPNEYYEDSWVSWADWYGLEE